MTTTPAAPRLDPWVFWAPATDAHIEAALDLAGVRPGESFVDLGCGDGRVLVAAARRGASVRGIEIDASLAQKAREKLGAAGLDGRVDVCDMYSAPFEADVIYAYLTPACVSTLKPRLLECGPGTRVVTPRYTIAGWQPAGTGGGCFLYNLPPTAESPPTRTGWKWRAVVAVLPADRRCLVPLALDAAPGEVSVELGGALARAARSAAGAESVMEPARVPVDLIFRSQGVGSAIAGPLRAQGMEITVAVVFAREGFGEWGFGDDQGAAFRALLDAKIAAARNGGGEHAT